ncbi:hypothetical protein [Cribrihabitans neustonicus]|uniref:hypothetical protein n=1 Tax=Cribrihabitans neustonicus TaxID=1429085 RepID=UPI003B5C151A
MKAQNIATYELGHGDEESLILDLSRKGVYSFLIGGMKVDAYIVARPFSKSILWCGQSAITAAGRENLPLFHRLTWEESFTSSFVTFNDPTLYLYKDLLGGWSQGVPGDFGIRAIYRVVNAIKVNINRRARSVYYGSSAGGFWALMTAALDKAPCMVEIPQTDMFSYPWTRHREALFARCYRDHGLSPDAYPDRLRVSDWFKKIGAMPERILYHQSSRDYDHIETQMKPFQAEMNAFGYQGLNVEIYDLPETASGHSPRNKGESVARLRELLQE